MIWLKACGALLVLIAVVVALVVDCNRQRECVERGGRVERYNCSTSMHCTTTHNGSTSSTSCYPRESCQWRCVGLQAEADR